MDNKLYNHGILGQKWGVRRYQNEDGTLTPAGKDRYGYDERSKKSKIAKAMSNASYTNEAASEYFDNHPEEYKPKVMLA